MDLVWVNVVLIIRSHYGCTRNTSARVHVCEGVCRGDWMSVVLCSVHSQDPCDPRCVCVWVDALYDILTLKFMHKKMFIIFQYRK